MIHSLNPAARLKVSHGMIVQPLIQLNIEPPYYISCAVNYFMS